MGVQTERRERISLVGAIAWVVCVQLCACPDPLARALQFLGAVPRAGVGVLACLVKGDLHKRSFHGGACTSNDPAHHG